VSVVDLHPEELLDKERRGELDEVERGRLEAHVARCAACRFERLLRADFADELGEPDSGDVRISAPRLETQTHGGSEPATERAGSGAAPAPAGVLLDSLSAESPPPRLSPAMRVLRPARKATWLLVAAALVVSVAAAGSGVRGPTWLRLVRSTFVTDPSDVTAPAPAKTSARQLGSVPQERPRAQAAAVATSIESPAELAPGVVPASSPASPPQRQVVAQAAPPMATGPLGSPPQTGQQTGSAAIFDAARSARLRGDYPRVMELHRELLIRYPQSREAQVSRATVGQLLLDRGDPSGALASFDAYLGAGSGELSEVVLVGRATALDRLGRGDEARRAWSALLVAFPDTPYAAHARARIGEGRLVQRGDP